LWHNLASARHARAGGCVVMLVIAAMLVSARRGDAEMWAVEPYNSGVQALDANRLDVAERKLRLASAYVPDNAELNFALGNLHLARGEKDAARSYYARTLQLDARHKGSFNNLGVLALEEGQWAAATQLFETSVRLAPEDAKSHYLLARAALGSGDSDRALQEIEVALRINADIPEFLQLRDQILAR
jgi:Flp pilus assembly protein TadD